MTRIVPPDEARALLENSEDDQPGTNDRVKHDWGYMYSAAPDLAHTVIAQAGHIAMLEARYVQHYEKIKRLQSAIAEIQRWEGTNYMPPLIQMGVLTGTDMGTRNEQA